MFAKENPDRKKKKKLNLLLAKVVYPYEYMDELKMFNEDKLPDKELF